MSNTSFLYVANWKAYLSFEQAKEWIANHKQPLATLAKDHQIVICPSFDALSAIAHELKNTNVAIGAQDCSAHKAGAFTGQVLAASLKEIGCTYCFIGHSEIRREYKETDKTIAAKTLLLLEQEITPIICIGESKEDYDQNLSIQVIEQQLTPILTILPAKKSATIAIGYEPLWAIGSTTLPSTEFLKKQLFTIKRLANQIIPSYKTILLYGGGANETNIRTFKDNPLLDGVLIGGASTDFQKLQKIVLS